MAKEFKKFLTAAHPFWGAAQEHPAAQKGEAPGHLLSQLPETGFLRLPQIIGDRSVAPPIPPLIPVGKSTWWAGVKAGRFPKPVKLGARTTAWRVEDIRALITRFGEEG